MMGQIIIALIAAAVVVVPAFLLGSRIRQRGWYLALFWGILVVSATGIAAALITGRKDLAAAAVGVAFGAVNGVRYGFTRPFAGLRPHDDEDRSA